MHCKDACCHSQARNAALAEPPQADALYVYSTCLHSTHTVC